MADSQVPASSSTASPRRTSAILNNSKKRSPSLSAAQQPFSSQQHYGSDMAYTSASSPDQQYFRRSPLLQQQPYASGSSTLQQHDDHASHSKRASYPYYLPGDRPPASPAPAPPPPLSAGSAPSPSDHSRHFQWPPPPPPPQPTGGDDALRDPNLWKPSMPKSRLVKLLLLGLALLVCLGLVWQQRLSQYASLRGSTTPVVPLPDEIWHGGAGSRRTPQQNLADPESIPHSELLSLSSTYPSPDSALQVSVLLLPQAPDHNIDQDDAPLHAAKAAIQHLRQSQQHSLSQPLSFFLHSDSTILNSLFTSSDHEQPLSLHYPSPAESDFTLILPLPLTPPLAFGPNTLHALLHLAHTKEFSGALLELGCSQAAFVQTQWLQHLDLRLVHAAPASPRLSWQRRGLSSVKVPVQDHERGGENDGFYVDGLLRQCRRTSVKAPVAQGEAGIGSEEEGDKAKAQAEVEGRVRFLVEPRTSWDSGWQTLACEFLHPSVLSKWDSQMVLLDADAGRSSTEGFDCESYGRMEAVDSTLVEWPSKVDDADVVVYALGGKVESTVRAIPEGERSWTAIGLPERDLAAASFIASLDLEAVQNWHVPQIDVAVITNNRPASLQRLTDSLKASHYFGDHVPLSISLEQTADPTTQRLVSQLGWKHGPTTVRHRIMLGGLMPAIVESWYPVNNDTYGVFLEDDVEVSPLFYAWLKFSLLQYRYTAKGRAASERMFGISLYQPKNVELRPEGRQPFDAHELFGGLSLPFNSPYLSQVPCSWGAAYFPETWREFHQYLGLRLSEQSIDIADTIVPDVRSNRWPRSWKKYFIEMVYLRGYLMLYPNYPDFESFSTNHLEMGTHVHVVEVELKKKLQFTVPLMTDDEPTQLLNLPGHVLPAWSFLPVLDLWGGITTEEEAIYRGYMALRALGNCANPDEAQTYDLTVRPTHDAAELLCPRVITPQIDLDAWEQEMAAEKEEAEVGDMEQAAA